MKTKWYLVTGWIFYLIGANAVADSRIVYQTAFETSEHYVEGDLSGQNGWTHFGSGGNGIVVDFFENLGQQAYVGFTGPDSGDDFLSLLQPLQLDPVGEGRPFVRFSVLMEIVDSKNERFDDFRWSVYNSEEARLFSLDFDNDTFAISYWLDGNEDFVSTGFSYELGGYYQLEVFMDFSANQWSAAFNDVFIVMAQPLGLPGTRKDLADIDAVWVMHDPTEPGDNYMIFDNYSVEAHAEVAYPVRLDMDRTPGIGSILHLSGLTGQRYRIQTSSDLTEWRDLGLVTLSGSDGTASITDPDAAQASRGFYRARPGN